MNHLQSHPRSWNLALVLGCIFAIAGIACASSPKRKIGSGGAGGSSETGGAGGEGGTSDTGGNAEGGSGGEENGGSGGNGGEEGGAGGNAEGGAGGSMVEIPPDPCESTDNCISGGMCETKLKICVQCMATSDCPDGTHCLGNKCVAFAACNDSLGCESEKVCDPNRGICVECAQQDDCGAEQACILNKCVSLAGCESNDNCNGKLCDTEAKRCVECLGDGDCGEDSGKKCIQNTCRIECSSDESCTPQGMLCDTELSGCVQCKANSDCPSSRYCEGGECKPDICDSAQSTCANNGVAACNEAGNGWAEPKSCGSESCQATGGVATCGGQPPGDGGAGPDGGSGPDAPEGCSSEKATPCTGIPKFLGTQTIDGKDDDICHVPSFTFDKASAGVVNNYNNLQDSEFPVVTARVGWSSAGLHAFFDVQDSSVQSVDMADPGQAMSQPYQGDSIELFVSSSDNVTGPPGADNAWHVTLSPTGKSVSVKTVNNNGVSTSYDELPAAQYKAEVKAGSGWTVEVLLPWQGSPPSEGAKVRFDLAINVADSNFGGVGDMRDAQLILNQSGGTGQTSCPGGAEAWCDDRTWCSSTLQ